MTDEVEAEVLEVQVDTPPVEDVPLIDYDLVYPHPLDENQNIVWNAEQLAEIAEANKPILAQLARIKRDELLVEYDKLVNNATRKLRAPGQSADALTELYAYVDSLDAYAVLLQEVPAQAGFPEEVEWPELPKQ